MLSPYLFPYCVRYFSENGRSLPCNDGGGTGNEIRSCNHALICLSLPYGGHRKATRRVTNDLRTVKPLGSECEIRGGNPVQSSPVQDLTLRGSLYKICTHKTLHPFLSPLPSLARLEGMWTEEFGFLHSFHHRPAPSGLANLGSFAFLVPPPPFTTLRLLADLAGEAGTHRDSPGKESWN